MQVDSDSILLICGNMMDSDLFRSCGLGERASEILHT